MNYYGDFEQSGTKTAMLQRNLDLEVQDSLRGAHIGPDKQISCTFRECWCRITADL